MGDQPPPPSRRLIDLALVPVRDRRDMWIAVAAPNDDVDGLPDRFVAHAEAYQLGPVVLTRATHPQQVFTRQAQRARKDGVDDLLCSIELSSGFVGDAGGTSLNVGVGQVTLWDHGRPSVKAGSAGETLCMKIDRDAWQAVSKLDLPVHGLTLGSMGSLFRDYFISLTRTLTTNPQVATAAMGAATVQLLAACVAGEVGKPVAESARPVVADLLLRRAERYIAANLADPTLSPERIANTLGISRSRLYNLFEASGGVAAYARTLRLELAASLLGQEGRRVADVAYTVGFNGVSQFNRAYKAQYGHAPGELRRPRVGAAGL
jgi:AraC-like DNA-binding protein